MSRGERSNTSHSATEKCPSDKMERWNAADSVRPLGDARSYQPVTRRSPHAMATSVLQCAASLGAARARSVGSRRVAPAPLSSSTRSRSVAVPPSRPVRFVRAAATANDPKPPAKKDGAKKGPGGKAKKDDEDGENLLPESAPKAPFANNTIAFNRGSKAKLSEDDKKAEGEKTASKQ